MLKENRPVAALHCRTDIVIVLAPAGRGVGSVPGDREVAGRLRRGHHLGVDGAARRAEQAHLLSADDLLDCVTGGGDLSDLFFGAELGHSGVVLGVIGDGETEV